LRAKARGFKPSNVFVTKYGSFLERFFLTVDEKDDCNKSDDQQDKANLTPCVKIADSSAKRGKDTAQE